MKTQIFNLPEFILFFSFHQEWKVDSRVSHNLLDIIHRAGAQTVYDCCLYACV